jgi:serine/threonine protein kinase
LPVTQELSVPGCCSAPIISNLSLTLGTRLGVYDITAAIGKGGMGQVFRARDTKLDRNVAIKILPEAFALDADRLARFTREAKTLASLNHPNIAGIFGLEESGSVTALVMELVEGEDLSQRIARGAIPIDEALPIAKQIADALEAAHEQGIIHRDLKPANIKVRPDGTVKVLDFGLAKELAPEGAIAMSASVSMSPTITTPAMTQAGMILGTAAYTSPEQAKGCAVDKRSDVWAFAAVLYEMLAGKRAFEGEDVSDTLARILMKEPDWAALPATVPAAVVMVMRRCLQKDRKQRCETSATPRWRSMVRSKPPLRRHPRRRLEPPVARALRGSLPLPPCSRQRRSRFPHCGIFARRQYPRRALLTSPWASPRSWSHRVKSRRRSALEGRHSRA